MPEKEPYFEEEVSKKSPDRKELTLEKEISSRDGQEIKELSPEFVKEVEKSKLEIDDKVNLLLTAAGLKPASEIGLFIKEENIEKFSTQRISEQEVKQPISAIEKSGIPFKLGERKIDEYEYEEMETPGKFTGKKGRRKIECISVLVGRNEEDLFKLESVLREAKKSGKTDPEKFGLALGFPPTAVEAFVGKKESINVVDSPREIWESDAAFFSTPTLSKDNWQEELKQGQARADFIKSASPAIYEKMVKVVKRSYLEEITKKKIEMESDALGYPIEAGIKEIVIALNAIGLNTTGSCEGHTDWGRITPWVDIAAPNEPKERFVGQKKFEQKIYEENGVHQGLLERQDNCWKEFQKEAKIRNIKADDVEKRKELAFEVGEKYKISLEDEKKIKDAEAKVSKKIDSAVKKRALKTETPEFKKWEKENRILAKKVKKLIKEFNAGKAELSDPNSRLRIDVGAFGDCVVYNGKKDCFTVDKKRTKKEKEELAERISQYRKEFQEFAKFLREVYY